MIVESDKSYRKLELEEFGLGYPKEDGISAISTHIIIDYPFMNFLKGFSKDINIYTFNNNFILNYGDKDGNRYTNTEIIDKSTGFPIRKTDWNPRTKISTDANYTIELGTVTDLDVSRPDLSEYTEIENEEP